MISGLRYITDDLLVLRRMSTDEYEIRMQAAQLKRADRLEEAAIAAFYSRAVSAVNKAGKPIVTKINQLIDMEKAEEAVFGKAFSESESEIFARLRARTYRLREYRKKKGVTL